MTTDEAKRQLAQVARKADDEVRENALACALGALALGILFGAAPQTCLRLCGRGAASLTASLLGLRPG
jgi:hypothetical protein